MRSASCWLVEILTSVCILFGTRVRAPASLRALEGRCRGAERAGAAAVTGGWGAVAVAVPAVVKRLGGDGGGGGEAVGGTDSIPRRGGGGVVLCS